MKKFPFNALTLLAQTKHFTKVRNPYLFRFIPAIAGTMMLFSACEKEVTTPVQGNVTVSPTTAQRGGSWHVYQDTADFRVEMANLHKMSMEEVRAWDSKDQVASLREVYDRLESDSTNKVVTDVDSLMRAGQLLCVPDPRLASVLNADGVLQIGKKIYVIQQHQGYIVPSGNADIVLNHEWNHSSVVRFEIPFQFLTPETDTRKIDVKQSDYGPVAGRSGNFYGRSSIYVYNDVNGFTLPQTWNNRPTRMKGEQWNVSYPYYSSIGVRTNYQFKTRLAGWHGNDASDLLVWGDFAYRVYWISNMMWSTNWHTSYQVNDTEVTLAWNSYPGGAYSIEGSYSIHKTTYRNAVANQTQ